MGEEDGELQQPAVKFSTPFLLRPGANVLGGVAILLLFLSLPLFGVVVWRTCHIRPPLVSVVIFVVAIVFAVIAGAEHAPDFLPAVLALSFLSMAEAYVRRRVEQHLLTAVSTLLIAVAYWLMSLFVLVVASV